MRRAPPFALHALHTSSRQLSSNRFKKRVPSIIKTLPAFIQKFVNFVCKQGIDPRKPIEVGNMGFDSGYDW